MLFRRIYRLHERIKADWRLLALVSYLLVAGLTTALHLVRPGDAEASLDGFLATLAGILTSVVVTTFSFVFVALQLASVQFSPRIVRSFFEYDHFSRFFLWSFLACVAYLLGLSYFGWSGATLIYPKFGIVGGFYLLLLVFPLFIHHVITSINASSITRNIAQRTIQEIETLYEPAEAESWSTEVVLVVAKAAGYLEAMRYQTLYALFPAAPDVSMRVRFHIGSFVMAGAVLAEIRCPASRRAFYDDLVPEIQACFLIGRFRSYEQDIPFGIRQLVDIAIKAISPAVNDPTTALNCLDYLGAIIRKAALSDMTSREAKLLQQKNIAIREFSFEQLVDLAFDQIYSWGKDDYIIVRHVVKTVDNVVPFVQDADKLLVLCRQVDDLELQYLHTDPAVFRSEYLPGTPFLRREHRNSLRNYLDDFYEAVIAQIEALPRPDEALERKKAEYTAFRAALGLES
ncbi:DUF2254 family protein [Tellurirhabdus rosea]|uniref:DUF2254 family protein n=1 Tax=Tellurirhabdus rosea TaxID=2674997 RepID=UPI002255D6A5|nr:DUF2254 family protein [Tellurirhabdus rosea]